VSTKKLTYGDGITPVEEKYLGIDTVLDLKEYLLYCKKIKMRNDFLLDLKLLTINGPW
jgi:hypothetical protein